jgi:hypothetical protein
MSRLWLLGSERGVINAHFAMRSGYAIRLAALVFPSNPLVFGPSAPNIAPVYRPTIEVFMSNADTSPRRPGSPPASFTAAVQSIRPIENVGETAPRPAQEPQGEAIATPARQEATERPKGPPSAKPKANVIKTELGRFEQHSGQKIIFTEVNKGSACLLEIRSEFGSFEGRAIAITAHAIPSLQGAIDRYRERATERELAKGKRVFT